MSDIEVLKDITKDIRRLYKRLQNVELTGFQPGGGTVPPAGTLYNHLEDDGANWVSVTNLTMTDDASIGLPGPGGRFVFDATPDPDQIVLTDGDLNLGGNDLFVPDDTADAMTLYDGGGLSYLRIVSTDAQPAVQWNSAAADIDLVFEIASCICCFVSCLRRM